MVLSRAELTRLICDLRLLAREIASIGIEICSVANGSREDPFHREHVVFNHPELREIGWLVLMLHGAVFVAIYDCMLKFERMADPLLEPETFAWECDELGIHPPEY